MSFNPNDTITLANYEEYFMLYVDDELTPLQKATVERFAAGHPHLANELSFLLSTKLPADEVSFAGKEDLLSSAMKVNAVDEALLLYIDDELSLTKKVAVESRIATDGDYAVQHSLLMQTKLDGSQTLSYPDKTELYRHERRATPLVFWLRIAAVIVVLLTGSLFLLRDRSDTEIGSGVTVINNPSIIQNPKEENVETAVEEKLPVAKKENGQSLVNNSFKKQRQQKTTKNSIAKGNDQLQTALVAKNKVLSKQREVIGIKANELSATPDVSKAIAAVNKTITPPVVTSKQDSSYNKQNIPNNNPEVEWAVETEKKAPARGFFRKMSRFIERKAGIGTVNADNELLIGAVALKLK